ncbi:hypothetical protein, partial [Corynebacterium sp. TAE3-ERU30]|uniref:hypothetical protein n=1 Tax=Corynebacterium sp. TAE3-ERU30 TaxID=2849496 RepID=UPI001C444093
SDYIKNNDKVREIDDVFGVKFYKEKIYTEKNKFFLHYNDDKTKLVIHTRQLSSNVKNDLLEDMAKIIIQHLMSL